MHLPLLVSALVLVASAPSFACDMHGFYGAWGPRQSPTSLSQAEIDALSAAAVARARLAFIARFSSQGDVASEAMDETKNASLQSKTAPAETSDIR